MKLHYLPGRDRERSYHLELVLRIPAASLTKISFKFRRALLKWTEYPPDANHGFYVSSAVISALLPVAITQAVASDATTTLHSVYVSWSLNCSTLIGFRLLCPQEFQCLILVPANCQYGPHYTVYCAQYQIY